MNTKASTINLNEAIARLVVRALRMNLMLGRDGSAHLLPDWVHPVVTTAIRALELSRRASRYDGTRRTSSPAWTA